MSDIAQHVREGLCPHCGGVPLLWGPHEIIAAIDTWVVKYGCPPTREAWRHPGYDHPCYRTVERIFGTLNKAIGAAGYETRARGGQIVWTRAKIIEAIQKWAVAHDGKPPGWNDWLKSGGEQHPTTRTVTEVFGKFNAAIDAAGFFPRGPRGVLYANAARTKIIGRQMLCVEIGNTKIIRHRRKTTT